MYEARPRVRNSREQQAREARRRRCARDGKSQREPRTWVTLARAISASPRSARCRRARSDRCRRRRRRARRAARRWCTAVAGDARALAATVKGRGHEVTKYGSTRRQTPRAARRRRCSWRRRRCATVRVVRAPRDRGDHGGLTAAKRRRRRRRRRRTIPAADGGTSSRPQDVPTREVAHVVGCERRDRSPSVRTLTQRSHAAIRSPCCVEHPVRHHISCRRQRSSAQMDHLMTL